MPTELLNKPTAGSRVVYCGGMMLRAAAATPTRTSFTATWRDILVAAQSIAESSTSSCLFFSALSDLSWLASEAPRHLRLISSPEARAAVMDPWKIKNGRRIRLIKKQCREGLTAREESELEKLGAEVSLHVRQVAPLSTKSLEDFESYVQQMRDRVKAKKG